MYKALCVAALTVSAILSPAEAFAPAANKLALRTSTRANAVTPMKMGAERSPSQMMRNKNMEFFLLKNQKWVVEKQGDNPDFFKIEGEKDPNYLWIGCSDARVPPATVVGLEAGDMLVHRNVANCVGNTDLNVMSVLQYAIEVKEVEHIIVCGHYECGGIKASLSNVDHASPLENYLRNIRDTVRLHNAELSKIPDMDERHRRLVELNVVEQCINVHKSAVMQRRSVWSQVRKGEEYPKVHALVFDPKTGFVKEIDWLKSAKDFESLKPIYQLYDVEKAKAAYEGYEQPYTMRPNSAKARRFYNRAPVGSK